MRNIVNILALLLLAALLWWLYPHRPAAPGGRDVTEITIWFNGIVEGRQIDVVDAFERAFPQYRVILGSSAARTGLEGEGNPQRLMCGIAGGVPPEVVEYDRFAICQWAARDAFLDLNPLIEADRQELARMEDELHRRRAAAVSSPSAATQAAVDEQQHRIERFRSLMILPDDFYPATWNECQYRDPTGRTGQFGIPNYMDNRVMYFNEDMLVQNGLVDESGRPRPPRTWEDVLLKRVDVTDARIDGMRIASESADFVAAGVRPGDTLSHVSDRGLVTRARVREVVGPRELIVESFYPRKRLVLPDGAGKHVKVFDQNSAALRLSRWDDEGRIKIVGFEPQHGNAWLYLWGWTNGGEFMDESGELPRCTLDDPRIVAALQWTTDIYDALGGVNDVTAFRKGFQRDNQDPFINNQIAMFVHGDWFLRDPLVRYRRDMRFGVHPPPVPRAMIDAGRERCSWVAGFAYCIPATCPPEKRKAAWDLVKFLSSLEGGMIMNEHDAQRERGQGRLYMPRLMASRKLTQAQLECYVNVPEMPPRVRAAIQLHLDMLPHCRYRPVSPEGQKLWNAQADAQDIAWNHTMTPHAALAHQARSVNRALNEFYARPDSPTLVRWRPLIMAYLAALAVTAAVAIVRYQRRYRVRGFHRREWYAAWVFILPWLVGFVVLSGGPMVFSAVMSLTEYDVVSEARFVGLDNYREMFTIDWGGPDAEGKETVPTGVRKALLNTLFMAIGLPLGMILGLGLALLLDTGIRGLKYYRTFFFLPAIMPVVAASILWMWVFNAHGGLLNWLLERLGLDRVIDWLHATFGWFTLRTPVSWLTNARTTKPALILMTLWGAGASIVIWLAGLKSIPTHLYEAAAIDGAGAIRRFFRVTLPMLSPYILFNLIIGLIQTFQIFTQAYIMTPNGYPERSTYFYVYKLFDECFSYFRLGYGAAMAWVLFALVLGLTLINMRLSKKWVFYAGE
ncbi:MAG: extracellular solute-binding protein [Phycisphaerae bacterium]|nr:extracellular solute-binding protein [Phycisphaerae bacterium]NUQ45585.1 extracellular solute-binding protein [Phycisphaerae bacterium]